MNNYDDIEDMVLGDDEGIINTDIKINPDFYIHNALLNAQKTFLNSDAKQGFLQYWVFIEHIESLCSSAGILGDDYENSLIKFKNTDNFTKEDNELVKNVKLANAKLKYMMGEVFKRKTITEPLKVRKEPEIKLEEPK